MKKKLLILTAICFLFSFVCGCIAERPEHLPGTKENDVDFVWVCEEPFSYFVVNKDELSKGYPCLKGYIMKENESLCFYIHEDLNVITCLLEEKAWKDSAGKDTAYGNTKYYEDYFVFEVERDNINFFDGELPTLRFDKMTKEAFLEQYGDIENIAELLATAEASTDEDVSSAE